MWHEHVSLKIWLYTQTYKTSLVREIVNWKKDQCICMSTEYRTYCNNVIIRVILSHLGSQCLSKGLNFRINKDHVQFLVSFEFCGTLILKSIFSVRSSNHIFDAWSVTLNLSKYIFFHYITSTCTKIGSQLFSIFFLITYTKCLFVKVRWLC